MDNETLEKFEKIVNTSVEKNLDIKLKGYRDELEELKANAVPAAIHTKGHIVDDGHLSQVGECLYKLPGGSVINTSTYAVETKGYYRRGGFFEKAGEDVVEFADKLRSLAKMKQGGNFTTKDIGTIDVSSAMASGSDATGGLFVPEDIRYAMLQFAPPGTIVWPRAQVWPMTTDKIQWPKLKQDLTQGSENFFGNVEVYWTEEGGEKPDTQPEFTMMALECHEISCFAPVTDQLLADAAINIGNLLVQLFQGAYWHGTDRAFLRGMGGSQPMGLLNAPKVPSISRVTANRVSYKDLLNMQAALPPMFDANAVWMMKKSVFNDLRKETDNNGRPVIDLGIGYNNFGEGVAGYALGLPIVMSDYKTEALGTRGDVVLGDWKAGYFIGERKTLTVEMSRHLLFKQNMTAFRASARVGGTTAQEYAFVVLDSTADSNMS